MFFNLGIAEIGVILLIGLLIFGPDRLPKAVQTLVAGVRSFRSAATDATRSLQEAAGWDAGETKQTLSELAELHPRRLVGSILDDPPANGAGAARQAARPPAAASGAGALGDYDPDAP